ncbi:MAG: adenylate/guanylate cyclase domain-containing protein, partial [Candidatus Limnocylindrales bacterium]
MPACANCGFKPAGAVKFCPQCGAAFANALESREQRKRVTVLFCDLTGSTALGETLDPERLRALLAGYFERMQAIVEKHGGTVEKFIGDAVMAVFGVPLLHEDDALRAVRAAIEMRDAIPELGLQGRIGVMTGDVVTGTAERLVTGDAVNVAARLEAAAQPGEVLIGDPTLALVRDAAEVEAVEPLTLKGKANPVPAYRLVGVHDAPERRHGARFVGRERELQTVRDAWQRVQAEERCELLTIIGDAGVGKSRLVAEALATIQATVVRGHCLPYGDGITYFPVIEVLHQLGILPPDEAAARAIRSLLGESEATTSSDEIAWAVRKTLEHAAAQQPLAVVFDDIQWAEQTFRDLIEHVALLSSGAAILLICTARPDLTERQPGWPVTLRLEPLGGPDVEALMADRIPNNVRDRIARAAGGNPLFIEEMVAMAAQAEGEVLVPPTLQALLAARLDQLDTGERSVLERGAIEGEVFHRGAVQALAPGESQVTPRLAALVRKQLVRPDKTQLLGEDGFRFRHLLIRDAAYEALPKAVRADLHARFAAWLEQHGAGLVELDELLGYHLEQAVRYLAQLGLPDDPTLAAAARMRLTSAGRRAKVRQDNAAAVNLLERAALLVPSSEIDMALELDLVDVLFEGGNGPEAHRRATSLAERAAAAGDRIDELCGRIKEGTLRTWFDPEGATEQLAALVEQALPVFEAAGDQVALYTAYLALGQVENMRAHIDASLKAYERAADHAQLAGLPDELLGWRSAMRLFGTTPVSEILTWIDAQEGRGAPNFSRRGHRAHALAMLGRFDEARATLSKARAELADRGGGIGLATLTGMSSADVELLAGDPEAAVAFGREGCRLLDDLGEKSYLSTAAGGLAKALYALDQLEEADAWAGRAADLGASDDMYTQMLWRQVRAKVLARGGDFAKAEQLAREAVDIGEQTDMLDEQGDTHAALAEVLALAGR